MITHFQRRRPGLAEYPLRRQLFAEGHEFLLDTDTKETSKQYPRYRPEDGLNVGSFCEQVGNPDDEPGSYYLTIIWLG